MIVLFSDFGTGGPYTGQMAAVLHDRAPSVPVVELMADAPAFDAKRSAYLLAPYAAKFPQGAVFLCVVDPGVGSERLALCLNVGTYWFIGPDNGLFEQVLRQFSGTPVGWSITWRPDDLSNSFHGRDLFAPVAARIASGESPADSPGFDPIEIDGIRRAEWPDDLWEVIYIDTYGNAITGIRASTVGAGTELIVAGKTVRSGKTFSSVSPGEPFCYENANGLMELAVNQGRADKQLSLRIGTEIKKSA